jgi:transposase
MSKMSPKKRRQYTAEYRAEAIRQVNVGDRPLAQVARDLGLSMQTLWGWVHPDKPDSQKDGAGALTVTEREELKDLRRRVVRLEEEREILKKATAFFARESK